MQVIPIPCFDDNYAYAVFNSNSNLLVLVDPADWPRVNSFIQASA